jgi:catechol 2,3-dioxygenase-like lactoylglutathione lyase family enzyme
MTDKATVEGLGHVGIAVKDMPKMVDFYTRILGLTVTDRGPDDRIVFMSAHPETEHHEFVLSPSPDRRANAQQISFTVGSLDDLKELYHDIKGYGCKVDRVVSHGIAFGCYFRDPEDNRVEVYWSTGMDYPQPIGAPLDLEKSNEELLDFLANMPPLDSVTERTYGEDKGKRRVVKEIAAN